MVKSLTAANLLLSSDIISSKNCVVTVWCSNKAGKATLDIINAKICNLRVYMSFFFYLFIYSLFGIFLVEARHHVLLRFETSHLVHGRPHAHHIAMHRTKPSKQMNGSDKRCF